jgi:hypothetical protein
VRIGDLEFGAYALGLGRVSAGLVQRAGIADLRFLDVADPAQATFFRLLNAGNALAYGGLGMPAWVQLDCGTIPTVMCGFARRRSECPPALVDALERICAERFGAAAAPSEDAWVPVSEFCAVPSVEPGTFVGFSLFSLLPGLGLGVRSKALGLLCLGARRLIGITQHDSRAERVHRAFGTLRVLVDRPAVHPRGESSYVYEVEVPPRDVLLGLLREGRPTRTLSE